MPRSASFRVVPKPGSPVVEEDMKTRLINGHARNDVESVIGARGGGEEGVDEEYLVQWLGSADSAWVPVAWLEVSMFGKGKVMEYQDRVQQRILHENALIVQRRYRQYRVDQHEANVASAIVKAQAIQRGRLSRRKMADKLLWAEAEKIKREARIIEEMKRRAAETAAQKRKEERDAKKAEQMRLVREQAQKLIEQQGGTRIDPDAPLPQPDSPKALGPITRLPRSPRSKSARGEGLQPGKMNYHEYVAALDLHLHRERVKTIRPAVDTVSPPEFNHLKEKLKFKQLELEKRMHITHENDVLARRVKEMPTLAFGAPPTKAAKVDVNDPTQAFNAKMQKLDQQQHRHRVRRMQHAVDADSPKRYKHLTENLKGKQILEDLRLETERNNRAMQARLASMQPMSIRKEDSKVSAQTSKASVAKQSSLGSTTGSRSSRSSRSSARKKNDFQAYLLEVDKKLLRDRVKNMQPDVDTEAPPVYKHLQQKLKGKQLEAEKEAEIKRLNEIQQERVANTKSISKFPKVPNMSRRSGPALTWEEKMERACLHGDEPMLNQALQHVDPSATLSDGWFPVALCSAAGQLGGLTALLRLAHTDAERRMADGSTPLRLAADRGHANCVDGLLKAHAESDVVAACHVAAQNGHLDVMQCFLSHRVELLLGVPHDALLQLRTKVEKKTPDIAALPQHLRNCFRRIETRLRLLNTFQEASKTGDVETLQSCLRDPGLSAEVIFRTGWNALGLAAAGDHSEAVTFLLKKGVRIDAPMSDGRTPLEIATQCGNIDVAAQLIESKSQLEEEEDQIEATAKPPSSRSRNRKLKAAPKQPGANSATALVPKPPPKKSGGRAKKNKKSAMGPRQYDWECGDVEGQTLLFGAVSAVPASA